METIPYDETRNYTKRVLASYFAYSWLYGGKPVPTVPLRARGRDQARAAATTAEHARAAAARASARRARSEPRAARRVRLLLLLAPEEAAPFGADALAAGRGVGAQVRLLLGA